MAVSKRVRFEVLRRDDHTCQYCGAKAPEAQMTVDHVMPVALGGDDTPRNLTTACSDCNSGKSSILPGSPLVESVQGAAAEWAARSAQAAAKLRAEYQESEESVDSFDEKWCEWRYGADKREVPRPADWAQSIRQWWKIGVPESLIHEAVDIAMEKQGLRRGEFPEFMYMAGIVWNRLSQAVIGCEAEDPDRMKVVTELEANDLESTAHHMGFHSGFDSGFADSTAKALDYMRATDVVACFVDGRPVLQMSASRVRV